VVDWCEAALARPPNAHHDYCSGYALNNLAIAAGQRGDYKAAHGLLNRALAVANGHPAAYKPMRAEMLSSAGWLALDEGDQPRAAAACAESLRLSEGTGPAWMTAFNLEGLASSAVSSGQPEQAATLFGAAEALRIRIGTPIWPSRRARRDQYKELARNAAGEERFQAIFEQGQLLSEAEAIEYVLQHFPAASTDRVTKAEEVS